MSETNDVVVDTNAIPAVAKSTRPRINLMDFVVTWEQSKNVQVVADTLGIKPNTAIARATKIRNEGFQVDGKVVKIPLKHMTRGSTGPRQNVPAVLLKFAEMRGIGVETLTGTSATEESVAQ